MDRYSDWPHSHPPPLSVKPARWAERQGQRAISGVLDFFAENANNSLGALHGQEAPQAVQAKAGLLIVAEAQPLDLKSAAKHIGIPPMVLHAWTWAHAGPQPVGNTGPSWAPKYRIEDLNAWLVENGAKARSIG